MANGYGKDAYGTGSEGWGGIGAALTIVRALAISTNTVRVTLSREPVHKSVILRGDATNPATWQVTNDRGVVYTVLETTQFAPEVWDVHVLESWDVYQVTHTVGSTTLVTANGYVIAPPNSADFPGLLSTIAAQSPQDQPPYAVADLANPPFPLPSRSIQGGSFVIAQNGDYALDVGSDFYRKMVLRVISIQPNGFPWAPGWGRQK